MDSLFRVATVEQPCVVIYHLSFMLHMSRQQGSGYYSNLKVIDNNPLFLLVLNFIIPLFTRNDLQDRNKKLGVCCYSYCISLSACLLTFGWWSGEASPDRPLHSTAAMARACTSSLIKTEELSTSLMQCKTVKWATRPW